MWEKKLLDLPICCKHRYFQPINNRWFKFNKGPFNCNSKKVVYLSKCKKCKNQYVGKTQTKFCRRLNNYKRGHKSFKTQKRKHRNYFTHIIKRMIMKVRTIVNLCLLINALLILNLENKSFIGNIILKRSFQMALMSVKNLVYNKLARQNIFLVLLIQFRF